MNSKEETFMRRSSGDDHVFINVSPLTSKVGKWQAQHPPSFTFEPGTAETSEMDSGSNRFHANLEGRFLTSFTLAGRTIGIKILAQAGGSCFSFLTLHLPCW